jgi:hypothetical protein
MWVPHQLLGRKGLQSLRSCDPSRPHSSGVQPQKETNTLEGIVLRVGQEARLDIPLVVGSVAQTAQVQADSAILDTGT